MQKKYLFRLFFFFTGIISLTWFLIRVIPKPSRAAYPCMKAAFPIASGFIVYLVSITSSWMAFRYLRQAFREKKILMGLSLLGISLILLTTGLLINNSETKATIYAEVIHIPNQPVGEAVGIFPGRVVWVWDRFATNRECLNTANKNGLIDAGDDLWYQEKNTDQTLITQMVSTGIQKLTGKTTDMESWDEIFRFYNTKAGKGNVGYVEGEKILIKLNRTSTSAGTNIMDANTMKRKDTHSRTALSETSPQMALAILRHLVYKAGVPQNAIYIGDLQRNQYQDEVDKYKVEFPEVNFLGSAIYQTTIKITQNGRVPVVPSQSPLIFYSDKGTVMPDAVSDKLYTIFEDIEYLINLPMMKGHAEGGITVFPKNHFGAQTRQQAAHLHAGLVNGREGYGKYRVQVDIMGSKYLGKKNLIYILDALYCGPTWGNDPFRFEMSPFNDDWTSSIFVSFDPVAIESVAFDFLRTELNGTNKYLNTLDASHPNMVGTDDYLHQAASEANWPAGIIYAPDGDNIKIPSSLGVHEHWNNATEKKYSRNLATGNGIELHSVMVENHAPYQIKETGILEVLHMNTENVLIENLNEYFRDYENQAISYSVTSGAENSNVSITGNTLSININGVVPEFFNLRLEASDGEASFATWIRLHYKGPLNVHQNKTGFSVYPNPANDFIFFHCNGFPEKISAVNIYELTGKLIYQEKFNDIPKDRIRMDIGHLKSGIYLLDVQSTSGTESLLFVKQQKINP